MNFNQIRNSLLIFIFGALVLTFCTKETNTSKLDSNINTVDRTILGDTVIYFPSLENCPDQCSWNTLLMGPSSGEGWAFNGEHNNYLNASILECDSFQYLTSWVCHGYIESNTGYTGNGAGSFGYDTYSENGWHNNVYLYSSGNGTYQQAYNLLISDIKSIGTSYYNLGPGTTYQCGQRPKILYMCKKNTIWGCPFNSVSKLEVWTRLVCCTY